MIWGSLFPDVVRPRSLLHLAKHHPPPNLCRLRRSSLCYIPKHLRDENAYYRRIFQSIYTTRLIHASKKSRLCVYLSYTPSRVLVPQAAAMVAGHMRDA